MVSAECLAQTEFKFVTFCTYLTKVGRRSGGTEVRGDGAVATGNQHVVAVVDEEIDVTRDESAEEAIVDTEVLLGGFLPVDVRITYFRLLVPVVWAFV